MIGESLPQLLEHVRQIKLASFRIEDWRLAIFERRNGITIEKRTNNGFAGSKAWCG